MINQSNLTIGGIGGDPSGSHPIGNLNTYWTAAVDDSSIKWTAGSILDLDDVTGAIGTGETKTFYSKEFSIGPCKERINFSLTDTGDAQMKASIEWYDPGTGNGWRDGMEEEGPGHTHWDGGTWTNLPDNNGAATAQTYNRNIIASDENVSDLWHKAHKFRVKLVATDAGSPDGITTTIQNAAINAINGTSTVVTSFDQSADYNHGIIAMYSGQAVSGSIGAGSSLAADPS